MFKTIKKRKILSSIQHNELKIDWRKGFDRDMNQCLKNVRNVPKFVNEREKIKKKLRALLDSVPVIIGINAEYWRCVRKGEVPPLRLMEKFRLHNRPDFNVFTEIYDARKRLIETDRAISMHKNKEYAVGRVLMEYYEYLTETRDNAFSESDMKRDISLCELCSIELVYDNGMAVCPYCGQTSDSSPQLPDWKNRLPAMKQYRYKRLSHLRDIMLNFNANKNVDIPDQIFVDVRMELKRLNSPPNISLIKSIMKKYNHNNYVKYASYVLKEINGRLAHEISDDLQEKIVSMFMCVDTEFIKIRGEIKNRKSMISYNYIIRQLLIILGHTRLAEQFPKLKDKNKLREYDELWQKICENLGWQFHSIFRDH